VKFKKNIFTEKVKELKKAGNLNSISQYGKETRDNTRDILNILKAKFSL